MAYETPEKPRVLVLGALPETRRRMLARGAGGGEEFVDVGHSSTDDFRRKLAQAPYYDAVAVHAPSVLSTSDSGSATSYSQSNSPDGSSTGNVSAAAMGMLTWLKANRPQTPALVMTDNPGGSDDSLLSRLGYKEIALLDGGLLAGTLTTGIREALEFYVLLAVPQTAEWIEAAKNAIEIADSAVADSERPYLRLEPIQDDTELAERCRQLCQDRGAPPDGVASKYFSRPTVRAVVVVTGEAKDDFVLFEGPQQKGERLDLPTKAIFPEKKGGYGKPAVLLYLAAKAVLAAGAGLCWHRTVSGCPMDFCFDLLDLSRGMAKGKICKECKEKLGRRLRAGTCSLTPIQIADVERLLKLVASECRATKKRPGGVPPLRKAPRLPGLIKDPVPSLGKARRESESKELLSNVSRMAQVVDGHFSEYSKAERILCEHSSFLLAARHYNSESPTIPGPRVFSRRSNIDAPPQYIGGGYFLAHRGIGIAIDPGYDFLRILYGLRPYSEVSSGAPPVRGYTTEDIDLVVVTHNHLDHHADLETILRSRRGRKLWLCCNREVLEEYDLANRRENTQFELVEFPPKGEHIELPSEMGQCLKVRPLPALHWQHTYSQALDNAEDAGPGVGPRLQAHLNGFGLHIELRDVEAGEELQSPTTGSTRDLALRRILITSDTLCPVMNRTRVAWQSLDAYLSPKHWSRLIMKREDWTREAVKFLREAYEQFVSEYVKTEADIACLHIGSLENTGWLKTSSDPAEPDISRMLYEGHHLGLMGCYRLLHMIRSMPKLVLMSEFGEELVGFRTHLCEALRDLLKMAEPTRNDLPNVLPTDSNLCIDLRAGTVRCTRCDECHPFPEVRSVERGSDVLDYVPLEVAENDRSTCQWRRIR